MRIIFKIAKKELQLLFYSPIAWLLLVGFIVQTALKFTSLYQVMVFKTVDTGSFPYVSKYLFSFLNNGLGGLWEYVPNYLFLYIPLLTMGIVSRDISNGSIKLMYSSPVTNIQIIMGKFVALMGYAVVMMMPLLIYVIFAWNTVEAFELAWVLTGLIGLYLLTCTYISIGIFVSSLTTHQAISAICSFIIFMLLGSVGKVGQQYDFVREITYWLSINGRAESFINGMICSEDLIYFISICATFIALTVIRINAIRQRQNFSITFMKNMGVVAILCAVALVSSKPMLSRCLDTTSLKENSLTKASQEIVAQIDSPVTITTYVNINNPSYLYFKYPAFYMENAKSLELYTRFKPDIDVKTVYYYEGNNDELAAEFPKMSADELMEKFCEYQGIDSKVVKTKEQVDKMADLASCDYGCVREIVCEDGRRTFFKNSVKLEMKLHEVDLTTAFKSLISEFPKVGYITGHDERDLKSGSALALGVVSKLATEFNFSKITLDSTLSTDYALVVLADPRQKLTAAQDSVLAQYIEQGGNLMILGEPLRRDILNPILSKCLGLELTPLIVHPDVRYNKVKPNKILTLITPEYCATGMYRLFSTGKMTTKLCMENAAGIEIIQDKGFQVVPFAQTDTMGMSWTELETTDFDNDTVKYNPAKGETAKVFATMVGLTRQIAGKQQKIIVVGDADMLSDNLLSEYVGVGTGNKQLMSDIGYWMSNFDMPLDTRRPNAVDKTVSLNVEQYDKVKWLFTLILPLIVAAGAVFLWIRRRGR